MPICHTVWVDMWHRMSNGIHHTSRHRVLDLVCKLRAFSRREQDNDLQVLVQWAVLSKLKSRGQNCRASDGMIDHSSAHGTRFVPRKILDEDSDTVIWVECALQGRLAPLPAQEPALAAACAKWAVSHLSNRFLGLGPR